MWRSWVNKINVNTVEVQEDENLIDKTNKSPEELKRNKELEIELTDLWRQCEDLLSSEQERSDLFLLTFLPKFCQRYGNEKNITVFSPLSNERAFMNALSRHLLAGIRKLSEGKTKAESSEALMNSLRSKYHLYYVIKTMHIVSCGPVSYLNMMLQQRTPSVIAKIFRSFIDLSPAYYTSANDNTSNDALKNEDYSVLHDDAVDIKEKEEKGRSDDDDDDENSMVSLDDAGSLIAGILERLVRNGSILKRLVIDDTLYTIMRLVLTKPAEWEDSQLDQTKEPAYMIWKRKTVDVLKSINKDSEVVQYIHSRRYIEMLVQVWKDALKKHRLALRDYIDITLDLDLINQLSMISIQSGSTGLYDELQQADIYKTLFSIITSPPYDDDYIKCKESVIESVVELIFIGKGISPPTITDGLPYQHDDFVFPKRDDSKGQIIQNLPAFQSLQSALLYNQSSIAANINKSLPLSLQIILLNAIKDVIQKNPINFFLIESTNTLPLIVETMENYDVDIQNGIMDLLDYVMLDLNFVPLKELAVLSLHLQNNSSGKLVGFICRRLQLQLQRCSKLRDVFRESGLINMMGLLLSSVTESLSQSLDNKGNATEPGSFSKQVLMVFPDVVNCVVEMTNDHINASLLRKSYNGNIFDLLRYKETRVGALQLFEVLSSQTGEILTNSTGGDSANDASYAFGRVMEAVQEISRTDLIFRLEILKTIKRIFHTHPHTRDVFRQVGGYITLVSMIVALENAFTDPENFMVDDNDNNESTTTPDKLKERFTELLKMILLIIMESMRDNENNRQYFTNDIGYSTLEKSIQLTGALAENGIASDLFGILLTFLVQDETLIDIFSGKHGNVLVDTDALDSSSLLNYIDRTLNDPSIVVANSYMAITILHFQHLVTWDQTLSEAVLVALYALVRGNRRNQIELNRSGIILKLLERIYPQNKQKDQQDLALDNDYTKNALSHIVKKLIVMGVSDKEIRYLTRCFGSDGSLIKLDGPEIDGLMDLLLLGTSRSRWPNFIHFEISKKRDISPSLVVTALDNFPPPSPGYTFMMWFHIDYWDKTSDLTLWTIKDDQQVVFRVYIEAATGHLRIYSAVGKQDSKFDSFIFNTGYWYHLCLVHHKSRLGASLSTVTLFLNGIWMEQVRCAYISPSTHGYLSSTMGGDFTKNGQLLQANNKDDSKYQNQNYAIWNLGPLYLLSDTLNIDSISVYFHLGARYKSLFKDSLRQFQTYNASTTLFLTLRDFNKRKDNNNNRNTLASVMRGATIQSTLQEDKILLAIFAGNTLEYGEKTGVTLTGLNQISLKCIDGCKSKGVILNSAIPKIEEAIYATNSLGILIGDPCVAFPYGIDESIWKIGGCTIALNFVYRSENSNMLIKSTRFLIEIVQYSWRNSEDMERCHGYEILANILKQKRDLISIEFFELLLHFIGKNSATPEESAINNPFAYRSVILNFEVWKKTNIEVQKAHLNQFILFMEISNRSAFNLKRLSKVHIVKKMLLAFRMNIYAKELITDVVTTFKTIVLCNWTTESIRAIATFLASTAPKDKSKTKTIPSVKRSRLPRSNTLSISTGKHSTSSDGDENIIMDSKLYSQTSATSTKTVHMCNIVMEMLHDILCLPNGQEYVHKFSVTITNKWPLLFFSPETDPFTVLLATRILIRILYVEGSAYMNKFGITSEGFLIMAKLLYHHWNVIQLYEAIFVFLMGLDISTYPIYKQFDINHLRTYIQSSTPSKNLNIHTLVLFMRIVREGSQHYQIKKPESSVTMSDIHSDFLILISELYKSRTDFKDACNRQELIDDMSEILFPAVCKGNGEIITINEELQNKEESNDFDDHCTTPSSSTTYSPIDGKMIFYDENSNNNLKDPSSIIKRGGTLSLMTKTSPHLNKKTGSMVTKLRSVSWYQDSTTFEAMPLSEPGLEAVLQLLIDMCVSSVIDSSDKNLTVLNMVLNSYPPSTQEAQMKFESYLLTYISQNLKTTLQLDAELLSKNITLTNVANFCQIAADAVIQGRFVNGAEQTYDLLATILEALNTLETNTSRRGSSEQTTSTLLKAFNRMVLLKISDLEQGDMMADQIRAFLNYCIHHQKIIFSVKNTDQEFLRCFCYHLYQFLLSNDANIKNDALNVWKLLILQKSDAVTNAFKSYSIGENLMDGFRQMLEMDHESFFVWLDSRKIDLNLLFKEHIYKSWENVIMQENKYSRETWKSHQSRRLTKLRKMQKWDAHENEVFTDYIVKTSSWSQSIQEVEHCRFTKALQDNEGHENFIRSEWSRLNNELIRERAIWGPEMSLNIRTAKSKWVLDFTEGRYRMRKKIRCISDDHSSMYLPKEKPHLSGASTPAEKEPTNTEVLNRKSMSEVEKELTSDLNDSKSSEETSSNGPQQVDNETEIENDNEHDNEEDISYEEDKNHKVLRLLDHGDMVLDVYNVSQIEGLDAREGLLLLCKQHIYLIDNFFQRADGEIVEIWDVPKHERDEYLLLIAQAAGMEIEHPVGSSGDLHTCRKWSNNDLREVFKRRFLFRDVALELFFADGQNALITVEKSERDDLFTKLANRVNTTNDDSASSIFGEIDKENSVFKFTNIFGSSTLQDLTQKWERREITNFQYLMYINAIAGRSYNDLTQYPVFPWILADYFSDKLDLTDPKTFRDLTKPMGAQTTERRDEFQDRYRQWGETNDPAPAFHYGTHYSSAMIVCSFLIRLEPFTQHYLKLQGGTFDHADRLFDSVGKAWESASEKNMGDVRELIPEFFCLPEFLENVNNFNFGVKQGTGEPIDSVTLPPWASGDPKIFIQRHREALESDYVSENLHHWIDLIFGYKQQGKAAIDATNVFHHVSYEGAVDLDAITDIVEKTATIGIINNFGQTPRQLFKKPHPSRTAAIKDPMILGYYPFKDHLKKLIQSSHPLRDIRREIGNIYVNNDRVCVSTRQQLYMPLDGLHYIEWGYSDNSLRLYSSNNNKLLKVYENLHEGFISSAWFPDTRTLVTGGTDNIVCIWKIEHGKQIDITLQDTLRGHTDSITSISSSRSYSIIVTGARDKTAIIWDLNRLKYIRSLPDHENGIQYIHVNDATGDIITCSGNILRIWSVNGELYLTKPVCPSSEQVLSCVVYDPKPNEWSSQDLIITGHHNGVIKFWEKNIKVDEKSGSYIWTLDQIYQIKHANRFDSSFDSSDIVSLWLTPKKTLLSGNRDGQLYAFVLPDTTENLHNLKEDKCKECTECEKSFSVLERKSYCRSCGGIYCLSCISNAPISTPDKSARFCKHCQSFLANSE